LEGPTRLGAKSDSAAIPRGVSPVDRRLLRLIAHRGLGLGCSSARLAQFRDTRPLALPRLALLLRALLALAFLLRLEE